MPPAAPAPTPTLRDRKRADAQRAIARAALRLASERGPDAVTVADIAAAADVSPRTVFNHFATKDDAILGASPERGAEFAEAIEAEPAELDPLEATRRVFVSRIVEADDLGATWAQRAELVHRYPSLAPARLAASAEIERGVARAIAARTGVDVDRDPYPRLVAGVCLAAVRAALDHVVATGTTGGPRIAAAVDDAFQAVRRGLAR